MGLFKMNVIKRELFDKLKAFYNDKDFAIGIMSNVSHDEDRQRIIEYIDDGEDVTVENIILLSLYLNEERSGKHPK